MEVQQAVTSTQTLNSYYINMYII